MLEWHLGGIYNVSFAQVVIIHPYILNNVHTSNWHKKMFVEKNNKQGQLYSYEVRSSEKKKSNIWLKKIAFVASTETPPPPSLFWN